MKIDKGSLLEMLHLERKRAMTARVLTATGLFLGAAVLGAAVALLVTPKSGRDLRKDLKDLTAELKENVVHQRGNGHLENATAEGLNSSPEA